jgi:hypothetical protein
VKGVGLRILSGQGAPARAVSDEYGEARFTANQGPLQLIVDDPVYAPTTLYVQLKAGGSQRETLKLFPGTAVTGRVVDGRGRPLAGADIEILAWGLVLPPRTKTNRSGHFSSLLAEGSWRIKVALPGMSDTWTTLHIPGGQSKASVTIAVPVAASLVVKTDCASKGCLGAEVSVLVANRGYTQYLDGSGGATFADLPVGDALVSVRDDKDPAHPAYGDATLALAPTGTSTVSVTTTTLNASASITGVLVDDRGRQASTRDGGQLVVEVFCHGFSRRTVAAADGSFTAKNLVPGECVLAGLRIDPNDGMIGANGGRMTSKIVAPAIGARVMVNNFFRP